MLPLLHYRVTNALRCDRDDDLRKDEIVENLENHLQANATRLSRNSTFEGYYGSSRRTPFKARGSSVGGGATGDDGEVKSVVKGRGRRVTKVKSEIEYASRPPVYQLPNVDHPHAET